MKVAIISPYANIVSLGVRLISASLRRAGHETLLIFLPHPYEFGAQTTSQFQYDSRVLEQVSDLCSDAALIGISLMTNYVPQAMQLTRALKERTDRPVVWGGIHPTACPEDSLRHADIVCLGEGEEAMVELVGAMERSQDYMATANFWFGDGQAKTRNDPRPPLRDVDLLPLPDYDLDHQFVLVGRDVVPLNLATLERFFRFNPTPVLGLIAYQTMATRGCPHNCTFCCNNALLSIYPNGRHYRRRGVANIIQELLWAKERFPFIQAVSLVDDTFLAASLREIEGFSAAYKQEVALPLYAIASPATVTRQKLQCLVEAGLKKVGFGIQSASGQTLRLYNREALNRGVEEAARTINEFKQAIPDPWYDVIVDNPFEKLEDQLETLRLLRRLPRPFGLHICSLTYFPGTDLYRKAKVEGVLDKDDNAIYVKNYLMPERTYLNLVFYLHGFGLPRPLLRVLSWPPLVRLFNKPFWGWLFRVLHKVLQGLRYRRMRAQMPRT